MPGKLCAPRRRHRLLSMTSLFSIEDGTIGATQSVLEPALMPLILCAAPKRDRLGSTMCQFAVEDRTNGDSFLLHDSAVN